MQLRGWSLPLALLFGLTFGALHCAVAETVVAGSDSAADRSRASMVIVSSKLTAQQDAIGAGVVVLVQAQRIRVVTARHVADHGPVSIWIGGRPLPAEIVRTFAGRDLAVLETVGPDLPRLSVRAAVVAPAPAAGSPLYVWGEDETGLRVEPARLVAPALHAPGGGPPRTLLSLVCEACAPGDSGGGIFDVSGALVGILTARYRGAADGKVIAIVGEPIDRSVYALTDGSVEAAAAR